MEKVIKETPNIIMDNQVKGLLPVFMGGDSSSKLKDVFKGGNQRSLIESKATQTSPFVKEVAQKLSPAQNSTTPTPVQPHPTTPAQSTTSKPITGTTEQGAAP